MVSDAIARAAGRDTEVSAIAPRSLSFKQTSNMYNR
jgi:hypothetical protein